MPTKKYFREKVKKLSLRVKLWLKVTAFWNIDRSVKSTCSWCIFNIYILILCIWSILVYIHWYLIVQGSWCIYLDAINILTWYCFYSLDAGKGSQHDMFGFPRHTVMINKSFIFLLFRLFLIFSNKHSFLLKCKMINASHIFLDFHISNL